MTSASHMVVLCSGFGLGFYVPGLLIANKCRRFEVETEIQVFESLITRDKLRMIDKIRHACQSDFRLALASQRLPTDPRDTWSEELVESLLLQWQQQDRRNFVALSGHWVHVLERYRHRRPGVKLRVDLLYLDADLTPSWRQLRKVSPNYADLYTSVRLYDSVSWRIQLRVDTNTGSPVRYPDRNGRLVVHGGGWGVGTFRERLPDLHKSPYFLDVVCYSQAESSAQSAGCRYFINDPIWRPWHRNISGDHCFPPIEQVLPGGERRPVIPSFDCHPLHSVIREAVAVVSKPGAGALIDSFESATPLLMLESFGPHEEANAELWSRSGFGIKYKDWAAAGRPLSVLEALHRNLLERRNFVKDYVDVYSNSIC